MKTKHVALGMMALGLFAFAAAAQDAPAKTVDEVRFDGLVRVSDQAGNIAEDSVVVVRRASGAATSQGKRVDARGGVRRGFGLRAIWLLASPANTERCGWISRGVPKGALPARGEV